MRTELSGIRLVAFDLDGVLVDSFECWWKILNETLEGQGKKNLSREEFSKCWGQDVAADQQQFFPEWTVDQLIEHYTREFPRYADWILAEPHANDVLARLKADRIRLAVASNSPHAMVERLLQGASLRQYFDITAGVDLVANGKPEPDLIRYILRATGVRESEACYVGDSEFDSRAAHAAGVLFVGYRRPGDIRIENLSDLLS